MSRARKPAKPAAKIASRPRKSPAKVAAQSVQLPVESVTDAVPPPAAVEAAGRAPDRAPAGLKLEPSCTLRDSIDMQFQLLAVDFGDSDVLVDGSAVERIDTAGLQMLLSFVKHQAGRGKPVRWSAVSDELARGSRLLGLAAQLGIPDATSGGDARGN
jgi:anti-anti-sigma regulatory factor